MDPETGCDVITSVRVEYKYGMVDSWRYVDADAINQTNMTIDDFMHELYEVKVVITNNENITSTSASKYVDFRTSEL